MFTGIIQNQGIVIRKETRSGQIRFSFRFRKKEKKPLKLGESIGVNGVCLTVAGLSADSFQADVIRQTLQSTTLSDLKTGDPVNLERSLKMGDEIGGHFVTGHVDAQGRIQKIRKAGRNVSMEISAPEKIIRLLAVKGSIAVDGISLTIQKISGRNFEVGIVPHTLKETILGEKKVGSAVNLEVDLVTRYLKIILDSIPQKSAAKLSVAALRKQGF